jgi:hypothetical protein
MGLLYSQLRPRCLQALHLGLASSHFLRRRRHVKQPERERRCIFEDALVGDDFGAAMALSDGVADDMSDAVVFSIQHLVTLPG